MLCCWYSAWRILAPVSSGSIWISSASITDWMVAAGAICSGRTGAVGAGTAHTLADVGKAAVAAVVALSLILWLPPVADPPSFSRGYPAAAPTCGEPGKRVRHGGSASAVSGPICL